MCDVQWLLISDSTMVDENGFLVDDDAMSRISRDNQEDMEDPSNT